MSIEDSDEYQTPRKYVIAAKEVMGTIDLDPACSDINYQRLSKHIINYYSLEEDGLKKAWKGNIWLNEPYSKPNLTLWTRKLIKESEIELVQAVNLVPSYTSERWYQSLLNNCSAICLPDHRIEHLVNGKIKDAPRFASTFFYLGEFPIRFQAIFSQFGKVFINN